VVVIELEYRPFATKLEEYFLVHHLHQEVKTSYGGYKLSMPITGWNESSEHGNVKLYKNWLFEQGISLVRKNKKLYLQFFDEQNAMLFILKWA
jgi:hypothetical protein